jgi:hypothetical protein
MEAAAVSALISQWGGFGVVLGAALFFIWRQHKEIQRERSSNLSTQKSHAEALAALHDRHTSAIARIQQSRVDDAKSVAGTLLGLQSQFNESISAMGDQLREHARKSEQLHQTMSSIDRRIDLIERRMQR